MVHEVEKPPLSPDPFWSTGNTNPHSIPDTAFEDLGWTTDAKAPMYYPLGSDEAVESIIP